MNYHFTSGIISATGFGHRFVGVASYDDFADDSEEDDDDNDNDDDDGDDDDDDGDETSGHPQPKQNLLQGEELPPKLAGPKSHVI